MFAFDNNVPTKYLDELIMRIPLNIVRGNQIFQHISYYIFNNII